MQKQRKLLRVAAAFVAVLAVTAFQATALADVIFDNTGDVVGGSITTNGTQLGDQVTAAGTARTVTELDLGFTDTGTPTTADLQAFLYANDGAGGAPGTLLWSSAVKTGVSINSTNVLVAFNVPSIVVPDTFTMTAAITNLNSPVGYVPAPGATTGTWDTTWVGSPGAFGALTDRAFESEARVIATGTPAVPLPSSLAGGSLGLLMAAGMTWRRRVRGGEVGDLTVG